MYQSVKTIRRTQTHYALAGLFTLICILCPPCFAISCKAPPDNSKEAMDRYGTAILGTVISSQKQKDGGWIAKFRVAKAWSKDPASLGPIVSVKDGYIAVAGAKPLKSFLKVNSEYLIYAIRLDQPAGTKPKEPAFTISPCGTRSLGPKDAEKDVRQLGKPNWIAPLKKSDVSAPVDPSHSPQPTLEGTSSNAVKFD